jgi:hypothetical protein
LFGVTALFGELGEDARLAEPTGRWLASLYEVGASATLARAQAELEF